MKKTGVDGLQDKGKDVLKSFVHTNLLGGWVAG